MTVKMGEGVITLVKKASEDCMDREYGRMMEGILTVVKSAGNV